MKSLQSLLSAYNVSASDPVVLWDSHAAELCGSSCGLENCLVGSIEINKKLPNQNPDFRILTHHVLPWFFHDPLWNLIGFKLICPWQKFSRGPCLKSCISSCNLRAQRAIDSSSISNASHFSSIKAHEKTRQMVTPGTSQY